MTDSTHATFSDVLAQSNQHHEMQMWRAAETVRSHVKPAQGRDDILECLGLSEAVRPTGQ
jgi:hypothetical protein